MIANNFCIIILIKCYYINDGILSYATNNNDSRVCHLGSMDNQSLNNIIKVIFNVYTSL